MGKQSVYEGPVHVAYMQTYVESREDPRSHADDSHTAGQVNGLCGAAIPGHLFLTTGMHTGHVHFTIEIHDKEPAIDDTWEEIVEASFRPAGETVRLSQWGDADRCSFTLPTVDHRVRYSVVAMDAGSEANVIFAEEPAVDHYLLQFWPAPWAPDVVVKQTGLQAAYWHDCARKTRPNRTPEQKAAIALAERLERERRNEERRRADEVRAWGGRAPTERLRKVGGNVFGMTSLDVGLVHAIGDTDDATMRAIARWAVHRAYTRAGLTDIPWIVPALEALDRGEPLPPPFGDHAATFERLWADPDVPRTVVDSTDGGSHNVSRQAMALPALDQATHPDPLQAALDALYAAAVTHGSDHQALFDDLRRAHPALAHPRYHLITPAPDLVTHILTTTLCHSDSGDEKPQTGPTG
ncbi:hypothetical protein [Streptomyces sp. SID3343]|uniref:hypothetical protein n=1 Tax=Streptomyces sp. SID3343 TaxID=2690260 RepID=UPI0019273F29|nr:hypothetical protein [Streptomyces sp. SID3343]